jgi:hypothetical protein
LPGAIEDDCTTAIAAELTGPAEPAVFVAVTATAIVEPTSAVTSVYVDAVCPPIGEQEFPEPLQRSHWYANVGAG